MEKLLRMNQVSEAVGYKPWTIYKMIREGTFPRQVSLGPRAVAWRESEVRAWIESREKVA